MVKDLDYAYAVARIRANERYMLTASDVEALISADSTEKAISFLYTKKWFNCPENSSIKEIAENARKNLWQLLSESVPDKTELGIFTVQNDFYNIKAALKAVFSGEDCEKYYIYPTSLDIEKLKDVFSKRQYNKLGEEYNKVIAEAADTLNKTESGQLAEIILDKATLEYMLNKADKSKCALLKEIVEFFVAVSNIKIAVKCIASNKNSAFAEKAMVSCYSLDVNKLIKICDSNMNALIEYLNKTDYKKASELITNSTVLFEKWCDDTIVELARKSKYEFFGFAPICGFYYGKINEIKTVKSILSGLENGLARDDIRERVRTLYV